MFVLAPLKRPPILLLWSALVAGGIGEELRRVALVWIAVDLIGKDEISKNRSFFDREFILLDVINHRSYHIGRQ